MADWKGILGALMVGGSEGYMTGKQQEWADEAAQLKGHAAQRLKQMERKQAVEDRDVKNKSAEDIQKLKGQSDVDVANINAEADKYQADKQYSGSGSSEPTPTKPVDLERLRNMRIDIEQNARAQAEMNIEKPGMLASAFTPGNQGEEYNAAVEAEYQRLLSEDDFYQKTIPQGASTSSKSTTTGKYNPADIASILGTGGKPPTPVVTEPPTPVVTKPPTPIITEPQPEQTGVIPGSVTLTPEQRAKIDKAKEGSVETVDKFKKGVSDVAGSVLSGSGKKVQIGIAKKIAEDADLPESVVEAIQRASIEIGYILEEYADKIKGTTQKNKQVIVQAIQDNDLKSLADILKSL